MFLDIAPSEMLLTVVVAVVVIGPKDMPRALRAAGRWMARMRKVSGHFRAGIETMIREAELEEMEKKWAAQNAAIMNEHPLPAETLATSALGGALAGEAPAAEPQPILPPPTPAPHAMPASPTPEAP